MVHAAVGRDHGGTLQTGVHRLDEQMRGRASAGIHHPAGGIAHNNFMHGFPGLQFHIADLHGRGHNGGQTRAMYKDHLAAAREHRLNALARPCAGKAERLFFRFGQRHGLGA